MRERFIGVVGLWLVLLVRFEVWRREGYLFEGRDI